MLANAQATRAVFGLASYFNVSDSAARVNAVALTSLYGPLVMANYTASRVSGWYTLQQSQTTLVTMQVYDQPDVTSTLACPTLAPANSSITCTITARNSSASIYTLASMFMVTVRSTAGVRTGDQFTVGSVFDATVILPPFNTGFSFNLTFYVAGAFTVSDGISPATITNIVEVPTYVDTGCIDVV
eukprot:TRINITY_DN2971_c0_g3_i3.p1 TRINITY_DN2971_c0_g3~~TRINITY_DN2971_c0_g3_i3.p1  ORF type:complete len:186 (-),score=37.71 TRINITY_DN2971_c0_g3_i3:69-626(-)